MTDTSHDNLVERAHRLDMLAGPEIKEWIVLTRQADRLRRDLSNARTLGRFTAAVARHGSPAEALRALQFEVEALAERLEEAAAAGMEVGHDRRELNSLLRPISSRLSARARDLHERKAALVGDHRGNGLIKRTRTAREKAISSLVEAGLPRRMADRQAKPSLADIEALEHELAEIPGEIERNGTLLTSYAGRMELYLAETTHEEEVA